MPTACILNHDIVITIFWIPMILINLGPVRYYGEVITLVPYVGAVVFTLTIYSYTCTGRVRVCVAQGDTSQDRDMI